MMRDLRAERELEEDARAQLELLVHEATVVALWAFLEREKSPPGPRGWFRRRFLERVWREKCEEVDQGRAALRRAAR